MERSLKVRSFNSQESVVFGSMAAIVMCFNAPIAPEHLPPNSLTPALEI